MSSTPEVPAEVIDRCRSVCSALPEAIEEAAWVGIRWRIRNHTFAHVLTISEGWPPAYARAAGTQGPAVVVTFRAVGEDLEAIRRSGHPYFGPAFGRDDVGMVITDDVDGDRLAGHLIDSYQALAPKSLAALISGDVRGDDP